MFEFSDLTGVEYLLVLRLDMFRVLAVRKHDPLPAQPWVVYYPVTADLALSDDVKKALEAQLAAEAA